MLNFYKILLLTQCHPTFPLLWCTYSMAGKGFRGKGFEEKVPAPGKKDKFHIRAQHGELSHCRALC